MYSVPDDRDYYVFPNNAVNAQGTLTYTVQRYESRAASWWQGDDGACGEVAERHGERRIDFLKSQKYY